MADNSDFPILDADAFLEQWLGNMRLTRRVIEAFPENELFSYSLGGMRTFAELTLELLRMNEPIVHGVATGEWRDYGKVPAREGGKEALLAAWDQSMADVAALWPTIPRERFAVEEAAFGEFPGTGASHVVYGMENEIHHRAQGYVYLRSLGIEPPAFYER